MGDDAPTDAYFICSLEELNFPNQISGKKFHPVSPDTKNVWMSMHEQPFRFAKE